MVQAEGESQQSQTGSVQDTVDDGPDADEDLLQWSDALDYDNYTRYAAHCCTNKTLPGSGADLHVHHQQARSH